MITIARNYVMKVNKSQLQKLSRFSFVCFFFLHECNSVRVFVSLHVSLQTFKSLQSYALFFFLEMIQKVKWYMKEIV